jgi:hypothetical protein
MIRTFVFVSIFSFVCSAELQARCSFSGAHAGYLDAEVIPAQMIVSSGTPCGAKLMYSGGPTYSAHVAQKPSHGSVALGEGFSFFYRSRPGYVGNDAFTYVQRGETTRGAPRTRTLQVSVTVTRD